MNDDTDLPPEPNEDAQIDLPEGTTNTSKGRRIGDSVADFELVFEDEARANKKSVSEVNSSESENRQNVNF